MTAPGYAALDQILVRAPLLPIGSYLSLPDDPRSALDGDLFRCAVAVASPDLYEGVQRESARLGDRRRVTEKLHRYLIRTATRPTPYGLFAGVGLAEVGEQTDLRIAGSPRTRMRPDMAWLLALVTSMEERQDVRDHLRVVLNPATGFWGGRAWLSERLAADGSGESRPVSVRATTAVRLVFDHARSPVAWGDLMEVVARATGSSSASAGGLLTQLWDQTFLLTELRPALTHAAPARIVADRLAAVPAAEQESTALVELLDAMADWDHLDFAEKASNETILRELASRCLPDHRGAYMQVDTALTMGARHLAAPVARATEQAVELLLRLDPARAADPLSGYRGSFLERYGADRWVPLLELIDADQGLGLPAPPRPDHDRSTFTGVLGRLAAESIRDGRAVVELDPHIINQLAPQPLSAAKMPTSVDLTVGVLAASADNVDRGDFMLLVGPNLGAQEAGRHLGRFADLFGADAADALTVAAAGAKAHTPTDLHVELVYLPRKTRVANVAVRPAIHAYEVVVGVSPGVPDERAIPLSELRVGVIGDRFVVSWTKKPGSIRFHAGHMLNPSTAPPVIRFLEAVSRGARSPLRAFSWGPLGSLPFLPRLQAGNVILAPAQWRVDAAVRDLLISPGVDDFQSRLSRWRESWRVPRRVYLAQGDNRLLLDLESATQADLLLAELRRLRDGAIILQEPLPGPEHAWLPGPHGNHLCEIVVSLALRSTAGPGAPTAGGRLTSDIDDRARARPPGSDWLYLKLYGPASSQNALLRGMVRDLARLAVNSNLAERWFFLRYRDPATHLRIRFGGRPRDLLERLLPEIASTISYHIDEGECTRWQIDTYSREVERYGGPAAIDVVENIFCADSDAVLDLLASDAVQRHVDPTTVAALSIDALLESLGLEPSGRLALYERRVRDRKEAGADYRHRKATMRRLLGNQRQSHDPGYRELSSVLMARRSVITPLGGLLQTLEHQEKLTKPLDRICESLVHMHCNRLLDPDGPDEDHLLGLLLRTREGLARAPAADSV